MRRFYGWTRELLIYYTLSVWACIFDEGLDEKILQAYNKGKEPLEKGKILIENAKLSSRRLKTLEELLKVYKRISIAKLARYLEFEEEDLFELEKWLVALKSPLLYIDGDGIVIELKETEEQTVEQAIDSLLKSFSEYERTGFGKKE